MAQDIFPSPERMLEAINLLDALFRIMPDLVCFASADGRLVRVNKAWESALGYAISEIEGRAWLDFVHPEDKAKTIEAAQLLTHSDLAEFTNRYRTKSGSWVTLSWRATSWAGGRTCAVARVIEQTSD